MRPIVQPALVTLLLFLTGLLIFDGFRIAEWEEKIARSNPPAQGPSASVSAPAERPDAYDAPRATDLAHVSSLRSAEAIALEAALERWIGRIADLKTWIDRDLGVRNPDLPLLTNGDWYFATMSNPLTTVDDFQRAAAVLANAASTRRGTILVETMSLYVQTHGAAPTTVDQLVPFLPPSLTRKSSVALK